MYKKFYIDLPRHREKCRGSIHLPTSLESKNRTCEVQSLMSTSSQLLLATCSYCYILRPVHAALNDRIMGEAPIAERAAAIYGGGVSKIRESSSNPVSRPRPDRPGTSRDTSVGTPVAHRMFRFAAKSVGFVADQSNDHAVQVEEEHQQVETQFDEGFL